MKHRFHIRPSYNPSYPIELEFTDGEVIELRIVYETGFTWNVVKEKEVLDVLNRYGIAKGVTTGVNHGSFQRALGSAWRKLNEAEEAE